MSIIETYIRTKTFSGLSQYKHTGYKIFQNISFSKFPPDIVIWLAGSIECYHQIMKFALHSPNRLQFFALGFQVQVNSGCKKLVPLLLY